MTTKSFKLVSGEEIIADVVNSTSDFVQLKNPMVMVIVGEGQLGMMPWLPLAEKPEVMIKEVNILLSYIPKQDLINHYKRQSGGIVTAGAGALNQLPKVPSNFGR